nr:F-box protein family, AtFBX7 [Arabidopsis thaliana]
MGMTTDSMKKEETQKMSENHDWSKLCPDILRKIIESLSSLDFYRAKIVCSDWYSVWKTCVKRPLRPWRIIYRAKYYISTSLMLFDPDEDKIYKNLVGVSDESYRLASSGNWLLMADSRLDFYIVNLLTGKRINLPPMESKIRGAQARFVQSKYFYKSRYICFDNCNSIRISEKEVFESKRAAVLWIDERTGDYFVAWIFNKHYLFTHKKGDDSWCWNRKWTKPGYLDLAYKNNKLYIYNTDNYIKIFDFSGDYPKEDIENNPYHNRPLQYIRGPGEVLLSKRIAIQKSGEVLIILRVIKGYNFLFWIFKMNFERRKWERVDSIGDDEMIIFGHGLTVRAPVQDIGDGVKSGSICFVEYDRQPFSGVFDLATEEMGRKLYENQDWSKLCPDLLRSILERLSFIDFCRAKTVCSDWYTVGKTCLKTI